MAILASPASGFARAEKQQPFEFPRDHAAHESFRTEWWYFTGHLRSDTQREFGFQLTLFRFELDAQVTASESTWRTPRVMLGHFALSDYQQKEFHAFERIARAAAGVAGISTTPTTLWLDDWRIECDSSQPETAWRVSAGQGAVRLELELTPASAIIAQGDGGLSRKSSASGNASYYYSIPNLEVDGELTLDESRFAVGGSAWLDREWGTSALDPIQQGWDWFALQFDDRSSLMFYRLRRADGATDKHSAGSFVDQTGHVTVLGAADVSIVVDASWTSPTTGTTYPSAWTVAIPRLSLAFRLEPKLADQEWSQRFRYWEGAVTISGTADRAKVGGSGYVEMTGY